MWRNVEKRCYFINGVCGVENGYIMNGCLVKKRYVMIINGCLDGNGVRDATSKNVVML